MCRYLAKVESTSAGGLGVDLEVSISVLEKSSSFKMHSLTHTISALDADDKHGIEIFAAFLQHHFHSHKHRNDGNDKYANVDNLLLL